MTSLQYISEFIKFQEPHPLPHWISYLNKEFEEEKTCSPCENPNTYALEQRCSHFKSYYFLL